MSKKERKQNRAKNRAHRKESRQVLYGDVHANLDATPRRTKFIAFGKLAILGVIMIGIPLCLLIFAKQTLFSAESWSELPRKLAGNRTTAFIALIFLQLIQVIICVLPGQPIQLASSYLFGVFGGLAITIIGAVLGCIVTYYLADFLGRDAMHLIFGEDRVRDYMHKLNSGRALTIVFLIYLIPGIPKDLMSYVAGISEIKLRPFLLVSTLGRIPGVTGSLLIGKFWASGNYIGVGVIACLTAVILILCFKYKGRIMKRLDDYENRIEQEEEEQ